MLSPIEAREQALAALFLENSFTLAVFFLDPPIVFPNRDPRIRQRFCLDIGQIVYQDKEEMVVLGLGKDPKNGQEKLWFLKKGTDAPHHLASLTNIQPQLFDSKDSISNIKRFVSPWLLLQTSWTTVGNKVINEEIRSQLWKLLPPVVPPPTKEELRLERSLNKSIGKPRTPKLIGAPVEWKKNSPADNFFNQQPKIETVTFPRTIEKGNPPPSPDSLPLIKSLTSAPILRFSKKVSPLAEIYTQLFANIEQYIENKFRQLEKFSDCRIKAYYNLLEATQNIQQANDLSSVEMRKLFEKIGSYLFVLVLKPANATNTFGVTCLAAKRDRTYTQFIQENRCHFEKIGVEVNRFIYAAQTPSLEELVQGKFNLLPQLQKTAQQEIASNKKAEQVYRKICR